MNDAVPYKLQSYDNEAIADVRPTATIGRRTLCEWIAQIESGDWPRQRLLAPIGENNDRPERVHLCMHLGPGFDVARRFLDVVGRMEAGPFALAYQEQEGKQALLSVLKEVLARAAMAPTGVWAVNLVTTRTQVVKIGADSLEEARDLCERLERHEAGHAAVAEKAALMAGDHVAIEVDATVIRCDGEPWAGAKWYGAGSDRSNGKDVKPGYVLGVWRSWGNRFADDDIALIKNRITGAGFEVLDIWHSRGDPGWHHYSFKVDVAAPVPGLIEKICAPRNADVTDTVVAHSVDIRSTVAITRGLHVGAKVTVEGQDGYDVITGFNGVGDPVFGNNALSAALVNLYLPRTP